MTQFANRDQRLIAIMRSRRKPAKSMLQRIDDIETEVDREWAKVRKAAADERRLRFRDTQDWLRDTRDVAQAVSKVEPEPSTVRVLLHMLRTLPRTVLRAITPRRHRTA